MRRFIHILISHCAEASPYKVILTKASNTDNYKPIYAARQKSRIILCIEHKATETTEDKRSIYYISHIKTTRKGE